MESNYEMNLESERARYAFSCVEDLIKGVQNQKALSEYRSEVGPTAFRIHQCGLLQTLAFYCSKMEKHDHFRRLALHIMKWVLRESIKTEEQGTWRENVDQTVCLYHKLLEEPDYLLPGHTAEALTMMVWLKRFTDARIEKADKKTSEKTHAEV